MVGRISNKLSLILACFFSLIANFLRLIRRDGVFFRFDEVIDDSFVAMDVCNVELCTDIVSYAFIIKGWF